MYHLYILQNALSGKFYIGTTGNIARRLKEHNSKSNRHFTQKQNGEWRMLYSKPYPTKFDAAAEENRLKKAKNRKYIIWYIKNG